MPATRPSPPTVELPRGVLIALCASLGVALLAVAFLLGRVTGPASPPSAAPALALGDPAASAVHEPLAPLVSQEAQASPPSADAPAPDRPAARSESAPVAPDPNERAAVARYFAQLEQIESSGKAWGDPQQLANQLVQQSAQGDRQAFEGLLAAERQARESLRALGVPSACREHHAEALALMDEAIGLLGRLSQAMAAQDLAALEGFVATATALEARTKRLAALEAALKRQYGLAVATPSPSS